MTYLLTADERARLDAAQWPYRLEVARQIDAERCERAALAAAAEDRRRYEENLAWAQWTGRKAAEEARKHLADQACDSRYCHECARLVNIGQL